MTDSVAVIEYGSHTIRAGLAYNFPSDHEPRLVRLQARVYKPLIKIELANSRHWR